MGSQHSLRGGTPSSQLQSFIQINSRDGGKRRLVHPFSHLCSNSICVCVNDCLPFPFCLFAMNMDCNDPAFHCGFTFCSPNVHIISWEDKLVNSNCTSHATWEAQNVRPDNAKDLDSVWRRVWERSTRSIVWAQSHPVTVCPFPHPSHWEYRYCKPKNKRERLYTSSLSRGRK